MRAAALALRSPGQLFKGEWWPNDSSAIHGKWFMSESRAYNLVGVS